MKYARAPLQITQKYVYDVINEMGNVLFFSFRFLLRTIESFKDK